ncbi:MAG: hypothetical protein J6S72_02490 [Lachnospiraceae bacterium]|nr:hypothetical protein [Lachnospiraceae bacterium]
MRRNDENEELAANKSAAPLIIRLIVLLALAAAVIVFLTCFKLENVEIRPGSHYTEEEIRQKLFTKKTDAYTVLFVFRINKLDVPKLTFVEKVDVEMTDRNSVIIEVHDKAITGCIEHMGSFVYFDREGIAVDSSSSRLEGIPLVKGVEFGGYTQGKPVDLGRPGLFDTLLEIIMLLGKNKLTADDICFGVRDDVTMHIGGNEIQLGVCENYDLKVNNINPALAALPEGTYVIDLRNYNENNREIDVRPLE